MTRVLARCDTPENTRISLTSGWYIDVPYAVRIVAQDGTVLSHIMHSNLNNAIHDYTQTVEKLTKTPHNVYILDAHVAEKIAICRVLQETTS